MQSIRVLLVDDHATFLEIVATFLDKLPHLQIVGQVKSGREALEAFEELRPDLVLVDLIMPEMNGLEVTQHLKTRPNPPYVVMMSFHNQPEYQTLIKTAEIDGFVSKVNFTEEFVPLIDRLSASLSSKERQQAEVNPATHDLENN